MLNPSPAWQQFERDDERASYGTMSYATALERFERLWNYARTVDPDIGRDWMHDIAADLAVARAINGLPANR